MNNEELDRSVLLKKDEELQAGKLYVSSCDQEIFRSTPLSIHQKELDISRMSTIGYIPAGKVFMPGGIVCEKKYKSGKSLQWISVIFEERIGLIFVLSSDVHKCFRRVF